MSELYTIGGVPTDQLTIIASFIGFAISINLASIILHWTAVLYSIDRVKIVIINLAFSILVFFISWLLVPVSARYWWIYLVIVLIGTVCIWFLNPPPQKISGIIEKRVILKLSWYRDYLDIIRNELLRSITERKDRLTISREIQNAINTIITNFIPEALNIISDKNHNIQPAVSFLRCKGDGTFSVSSQWKIQPSHIGLIETKFRWSPNPVGLAGLAVVKKETINIVNLSAPSEKQYFQRWVDIVEGEDPHQSIFCKPIVIGRVKESTSRSIAVICVTAHQANVWKKDDIEGIINVFAEAIETLLDLEHLL